MKPPQCLRFDTLNIALSYGIRSIASGNFIIVYIYVMETFFLHNLFLKTNDIYLFYYLPNRNIFSD